MSLRIVFRKVESNLNRIQILDIPKRLLMISYADLFENS